MFEVSMQGESHYLYPLAISMDSAILRCYADDISKGGNGVINWVKNDNGDVFKNPVVKFEIIIKKKELKNDTIK